MIFSPDELFDWVKTQAGFGHRRPGSPGNRANEDFIYSKLEEFGLSELRREPVPLTYWDSSAASLIIGERDLSPFAIPYTAFTPAEGIKAPMKFVDSKRVSPGNCRGKIVVTEIGFPSLDPALLSRISLEVHDPENRLKHVQHPATWVRLGWHLYSASVRNGAVGFIGIVRDQPGGSCRMYAPYGFREKNILDKPIAGLWVSRREGERLIALARSGAEAHLTSLGTQKASLTHNIVAEIPGQDLDDEVIVLSTHHDSPFVSPVEDASGVAVVLALSRWLAAAKLRRRVVVLFTSGHFYGSLGTRSFIAKHRSGIVSKTALEISIEHIALEAVENEKGVLVPSGFPEPAGIFVPFCRGIRDLLREALESSRHSTTLLLPSEGPLGPYPPTDGGDWYEAGVPLVNYISNPVYLLADDDGLDWVDREGLFRVARLFSSFIARTDRFSRKEISRTDFPIRRIIMKMLRRVTWARTTRFGFKPVQ